MLKVFLICSFDASLAELLKEVCVLEFSPNYHRREFVTSAFDAFITVRSFWCVVLQNLYAA